MIARLKDPQERQKLLEATITEDLSLNEVKDCIKSLEFAKATLDEGQPRSLKKRMDKAYAKIKKSKIWDDQKKAAIGKALGSTGSLRGKCRAIRAIGESSDEGSSITLCLPEAVTV